MIFIAVLVGGLLLGIPGALLAIPVVEIMRIVVTEVLAYRRNETGGEQARSLIPVTALFMIPAHYRRCYSYSLGRDRRPGCYGIAKVRDLGLPLGAVIR